jgi:hypothetical protein
MEPKQDPILALREKRDQWLPSWPGGGDSKEDYFELRDKAWKQLCAQGFPSRKKEDYLYSQWVQRLEKWQIKTSAFHPNTSMEKSLPFVLPDSWDWKSFSFDALLTLCFVTQVHEIKAFENGVTLDGVSLKGTEISLEELIGTVEKQDRTPGSTLWIVHLNPSCKLDLSWNTGAASSHWPSQLMWVHGMPHSELNLAMSHGPRSSADWNWVGLYVGLKAQAQFHLLEIQASKGAHFSRSQVELLEEGAQARLHHIQLGFQSPEKSESTPQALWTQVNHHSGNTKAKQVVKSLVAHHGVCSFSGMVKVPAQSQKIEARQLHKSLLLAPTAKSYSRPQMEILANDVVCSHGSTVGSLDPQELFYLRSRGIAQSEAKGLLARSFCEDLIDSQMTPSTQARCQKELRQLLEEALQDPLSASEKGGT